MTPAPPEQSLAGIAADPAVQRATAAADATGQARVLTCGEWVLVFKPTAPLPPGCDGPHKIFDSMPFHDNIPAVPLPPPDVRPPRSLAYESHTHRFADLRSQGFMKALSWIRQVHHPRS